MVSPRCRSTDTTCGCGPGTSRRCRARVVRRRGRGRTSGVPCAVGPARSPSAPRASLGALVRCMARPRPRAFQVFFTNFACNSPATISNHGFAALELQRFEASLWRGLVLRGVWERACAWFLGNVARNSPVTTSKLEIIALELQRFEQFSKNDRGKLCATFVWRGQAIPL